MNRKKKRVAAFLCGVAAVATVLPFFSSTSSAPEKEQTDSLASHSRWSRERIAGLIAKVEQAESTQELLAAIGKLTEIPSDQIEQALELSVANEETSSADGDPSMRPSNSTLTLLAKWGGVDGRAAAGWAWRRYGPSQSWETAFMALGSTWAWKDPIGAVEWATSHMLPEGQRMDFSLEKSPADNIRLSREPLIDNQMLLAMRGWIVKKQPRLGYEMLRPFLVTSQFPSEVLETADQVREALLAFPQLLESSPSKSDAHCDVDAWSLLNRWSRIDPEGFDQSPYKRWLPDRQIQAINQSVGEWQNLSVEERAGRAKQLVDESGQIQGSLYFAEYPLAATWARIDPQACSDWIATLPHADQPVLAMAFAIGRASEDAGASLEALKAAPALAQRQAFPRLFYSWSSTHPGELPDMDDWPELWHRSWMDLETLRKVRERSGIGKNGLTF